ncbi:MAG: hypothetical protein JWM80_6367 [Cyanobacteria bacterium RYN_339]|nr:hypothetical protein [Cyanobacteria bacterium RYN_339]
MSLIDPTQRADLGYWPERRPKDRRERGPFKLADRRQPDALPPAPLAVLITQVEPVEPAPTLPNLRITFYAEHQPLATPEPRPGTCWDVSV